MTSIAHESPTEGAPVRIRTETDPRVPARWLVLLGIPFIVGGALFGIGISTGKMWLMAPAAIFGPGAMILGFTYLGLSADINRFD
ncbi:MAG: hypothetical protein JO186_02315 [Actinobacteria bacterium]|nr:hypothetical protein [Actinomycetota bacterium]MBV8396810.1 hypothetical protein [Actinomycetota bacterium]MBV8598778.1 hypothetical protein [Actinomycetota bacterium]